LQLKTSIQAGFEAKLNICHIFDHSLEKIDRLSEQNFLCQFKTLGAQNW